MDEHILKQAIVDCGIIGDTNNKQQAYMTIKKLIDQAYMQDVSKCVKDVCHTPLRIIDDLTPVDIRELQDVAEDLCHYMSQSVENGLSTDVLERVRNYFSYINMTIEFNADTLVIAKSMQRFYQLIYQYRDEFLHLESNELELVSGFVNDFKRWVNLTFVSKSDNPHLLDDSILANYELIERMIIKLDNEEEVSIDDIFNF